MQATALCSCLLCLTVVVAVNADALKTIAQLHALTNLNIASCEDVMDEGLQALATLADLDSLVAVDCRLTDEGVASLQKVGVRQT